MSRARAEVAMPPAPGRRWLRRARPLLGTLVDIGAAESVGRPAAARRAIDAAFARVAEVQARLSRFDATSEIGRFNAAPVGAGIAIGTDARVVLDAALALRDASDGAFDVSLGSGVDAWRCGARGLEKLSATVRLDLGGIAKGYAVDCAVAALAAAGVDSGWVNAGGDLRAFGTVTLPIHLRDETGGGVRRFALLEDGAFATSRGDDAHGSPRHASVAAATCLWADALTKVVVLWADADHPLLARFSARAWLHTTSRCVAVP